MRFIDMTFSGDPFDYSDEWPDFDPYGHLEDDNEMTIEIDDPFAELAVDEELERQRATIALKEAVENFVAFGGTHYDILKILEGIL